MYYVNMVIVVVMLIRISNGQYVISLLSILRQHNITTTINILALHDMLPFDNS